VAEAHLGTSGERLGWRSMLKTPGEGIWAVCRMEVEA